MMQSRNSQELFISEHAYYFTPNDRICENYIRNYNLKTNPNFLKELSRYFFHRDMMSEEYISDYYLNTKQFNSDQLLQIENKASFFKQLEDYYIPGYNSIDKAVFLLQYLEQIQKNDNVEESLGDTKSLQKMFDDMKEDLEESETWKCEEVKELENTKKLKNFKDKFEFFKKIAKVDCFGKTFEIKKKVKDKRVQNSFRFKTKKLTHFEDIIKMPLYQMLYPDYSIKLAKKELLTNVPCVPDTRKQKIIILIDNSSSMSTPEKMNWVNAVVANRLQYAMKKECELFISYFVTVSSMSHYKFSHIYDRESALAFWKTFNYSPPGGGTEISEVIDKVAEEIHTNKKLFNLNVDLSHEKPEILIVNDGQDHISTKVKWKTNAITIEESNKGLEDLCIDSGGSYIELNGKGRRR